MAHWADSVIVAKSVCLYVCMFVPSREVPFKCLFAPIYKGPRSNLFGFFYSLGKSYGKEVVPDFEILAWKWSKIAAQKKVLPSYFVRTVFVEPPLAFDCI